MIPVIDVSIDKSLAAEIKRKVSKVIDSGSYILGKELEAFEKKFARINQSREAIGVANGTDALRLSIRALGINRGDKIIISSLTSPFTAISILEEGAIPVFCDVDAKTWTIDPIEITKHLDKTVKAIMPVHIYGNPADMMAINKIARNFNLKIIEDACQAHLAKIDNKYVGNWGDVAAFSFYPTKNLGAMGDAGAVITNNRKLANEIKILRHGGQTKRFWHVYKGFNSRLDEIQATILLTKLKFLKTNHKKRSKIAKVYIKELSGLPIDFQNVTEGNKSANHLFVIRTRQRDKLRNYLAKKGIMTGVYYPYPVHVQPAFKNYSHRQLPVTEQLTKSLLALPLYPSLSQKNQEKIIESIKKFFH